MSEGSGGSCNHKKMQPPQSKRGKNTLAPLLLPCTLAPSITELMRKPKGQGSLSVTLWGTQEGWEMNVHGLPILDLLILLVLVLDTVLSFGCSVLYPRDLISVR